MLAHLRQRGMFVLLFTAIWVVLHGHTSVYTVVSGIMGGIVCLWICPSLLGFDYTATFALPLGGFLRYALGLVVAIYKAGLETSWRILTGRIAPTFLDIDMDTRIQSPVLQHMIGSSITLTPGTITVDNQHHRLKVLTLHPPTDGHTPAYAFEQLLLPLQQRLRKGD